MKNAARVVRIRLALAGVLLWGLVACGGSPADQAFLDCLKEEVDPGIEQMQLDSQRVSDALDQSDYDEVVAISKDSARNINSTKRIVLSCPKPDHPLLKDAQRDLWAALGAYARADICSQHAWEKPYPRHYFDCEIQFSQEGHAKMESALNAMKAYRSPWRWW